MGLYNEHTVKVLNYLNHVYTVVLICVTSCHVCLDLSGNTKIEPIGTKVLWGSFSNYLRGLESGGGEMLIVISILNMAGGVNIEP